MKQCIAFAALAAMAAGVNAAPPEGEPKQPGFASHEKSGRGEAPAQYRSAFEGYRRYEDRDLASWRELNDEVARAAAKPAPGVSKPPAHEPDRSAR
jgi:hypothetical protein